MTSFLNGMSSPKQRESAMLFTDPHSAKNVRVPGPDYEELLLHNSSDSIATRLVYIPNDNIDHIVHSSRVGVDSVVCVHRLGKIGMIVEFFDMRDSVEFFAKCGVDSEGSEGSNCTFCCPTILSKIYDSYSADGSTIMVEIKIPFDCSLSIDSVVSWMQSYLQSIGPCQLSNNTFLDVCTRSSVKLFVEYLDVRLLSSAINRLHKCTPPASFKINWKACELILPDRQALYGLDIGPKISSSSSGHSRLSTSSELDFFTRPFCDSPTEYDFRPGCGGGNQGEYEIDFGKIETGLDLRTTCMVRNIPNKYTQQMLIDMINETHYGTYDFIYLRMDFKNKCNVGYAFINFIEPSNIITFARRVMGKRWPRFNSDKICQLTYARIQGKGALLEKFRHSKVMMEPASYRPKVYHSDGIYRGLEESFPF